MSTKQHKNEEIEITDLFRMLSRGFHNIGNTLLRFINFLIRNIVILLILIVVGIIAGYFVDKQKERTLATEMIVATSADSGRYLRKSIKEIMFKMGQGNASFYEEIGLSKEDVRGISIKVEPIVSLKKMTIEEERYIEFIEEKKVVDNEDKNEVYKDNSISHAVTLFHPEKINSNKVLQKIITHLRKNEYFLELNKGYHQAITKQLQSNTSIVQNIDSLVQSFSKNLAEHDNQIAGENARFVNTNNTVDLGVALESMLYIEGETKNLWKEKTGSAEFLRIIDQGSPVVPPGIKIVDKKIIFYPLLLILVFFLIKIAITVIKKARAIDKTNQ